jgi:hypothetical protein
MTLLKESTQNRTESSKSRNKVFMTALSIVWESLIGIDREHPKHRKDVLDELLSEFNKCSYIREGWLPLHWAVTFASLGKYDVTEDDVHSLYASDPSAMHTTHNDNPATDYESMGLTPAHLLCMNPVTPCGMRLVRSLSECCPSAFAAPHSVSALYIACRHGTPTVELLQCLLQLDASQATAIPRFEIEYGNDSEEQYYPLGQLCYNMVNRADELPNAEDLLSCLLQADKSDEVVGDALFACININRCYVIGNYGNGRMLGMIDTLLKANPAAARHVADDPETSIGRIRFYEACCSSDYLPSDLCIDILKLVLAHNKDAMQLAPYVYDIPPLYYAAYKASVDVLAFFTELYPEMCDGTHLLEGNLTLLEFATYHEETSNNCTSRKEAADTFRWVLDLYPAAAGIEGGLGADKKTPYQLAVDGKLPDYYLRLLLRAAPTLNPAELRRLNYAERRMAMFLAFRAMSSTMQAPLLARLRGESKDLVRRVVSFL